MQRKQWLWFGMVVCSALCIAGLVAQAAPRNKRGGGGGGDGADSVTAAIRAAYSDLLGREPDADGLRNYRSLMIDEKWTIQQVRDDIKKGQEYRNKSLDGIIKNAYLDLLGRAPDKEGLARLKRLMLDEGWTEKQVRDDIKKSAEYQKKH